MNPLEPGPVHAPHVPLTDYYQTEQDRQAYLRQIFDNTAPDYDRIESMLAWGTGSRYRKEALIRGGLKKGMRVLDVGVGTGLVAAQACILAGDASLVTGIDPSPGMMAASKLPPAMQLIEGRAESLPFPDNHFDFLSMGYALRHISDLSVAFAEFERVLKPGGRLLLIVWVPGWTMFAVANVLAFSLAPQRAWRRMAASAGLEICDEGIFNGSSFFLMKKPEA